MLLAILATDLGGKEPCSTNLINRFCTAFREELDKARTNKGVSGVAEKYPHNPIPLEKLKTIASTLMKLASVINQMV